MRRAPGSGSVTHRGGDRYLLRLVTSDGKRRAKTIRAASPEEAQDRLDQLLAVLSREGQASPGGVTLRGWIGDWLARRELEKNRSIVTYRSRAENHLLTSTFVDDLLVNVRPRDVRGLMRSLLASGLHAHTVQGVLALLRIILRDAIDDELIDSNPAASIRIPRAERSRVAPVRAPLTKAELEAVLASDLPLADRAIIATGAVVGLRSGELFSLPRDHVEDHEGLLVVHVEFGGFGGAPTKSGKPRRVPVLGPARALLDEWLADVPRGAKNPERLLFPGRAGGRRRLTHASKWLRHRLKLCGIAKEIRFHDLRHTAATALQNGWFGPALAPEHVQAILGHASIAQTEEYTGGAVEAMFAAARAFAPPKPPAREPVADGDDAKDQNGISAAVAASGIAAIQAKSASSVQRTPCSHASPVISPGSVGSDPTLILRAATEELVRACASRQATPADVLAWLDLVIENEPEPWRSARALRDAEPGRFLFRQALEVARQVLEQLGPAAGDVAGQGGPHVRGRG